MIRIAERLHPFSHSPGVCFLLPFTAFKVHIYPTRLCFKNVELDQTYSVDLKVMGPLDEFTAEMDVERGVLKVWGKASNGFVRYHIFTQESGIWLFVDKAPGDELTIISDGHAKCVASKEQVQLIQVACDCSKQSNERISLGVTKAQEWEKMKQRGTLEELLPLWIRMGQMAPQATAGTGGMFELLQMCKSIEKNKMVKAYMRFFQAAFEGVFVPRLVDTEFLGIVEGNSSGSCLQLLKESAALLRSLFIDEREEGIALLQGLPPEFHCGRIVQATTAHGVCVDLEWTKKRLRKVQLRSAVAQIITLIVPKGIVSCRIKRGKKIEILKAENRSISIGLEPSKTLFLDRFEY